MVNFLFKSNLVSFQIYNCKVYEMIYLSFLCCCSTPQDCIESNDIRVNE